MNVELIQRYNALISADDTVMWLGDCFMRMTSKEFKQIMQSLNGKKILIKGNHDKGYTSMLDKGFDIVMDECFMSIGGRTCRFKHYPYWDPNGKGGRLNDRYQNLRPPRIKQECLIHGHTHSKNKVSGNMIHVGVDAWNYSVALYSEVEKLVEKV